MERSTRGTKESTSRVVLRAIGKRVVVDDGLGSYVNFGVDIEANVYS